MEEHLIMKKAKITSPKTSSGKKLQVSDKQHQAILELSEYTGRNIYEITWELLNFALSHVKKQDD